jgi:hypothetical protein
VSLSLPPLPAMPPLALPRLDARIAGRLLALGVALALLTVVVWAVGPGNLADHLLGSARREASVFIRLLGIGIGAVLVVSVVALLRGKPGWSIAITAAPLLVMWLLLGR